MVKHCGCYICICIFFQVLVCSVSGQLLCLHHSIEPARRMLPLDGRLSQHSQTVTNSFFKPQLLKDLGTNPRTHAVHAFLTNCSFKSGLRLLRLGSEGEGHKASSKSAFLANPLSNGGHARRPMPAIAVQLQKCRDSLTITVWHA